MDQRSTDLYRLGRLKQEIRALEEHLGLAASPLARQISPATAASMYQLIAAYSTDLLSIHAPNGDYMFVSPNCERFFGWSPEELLGRSAYEFFHPQDLARIAEDHARHGAELSPEHRVKYRILCKGGDYLWVETRSRAQVENSLPQHIICITHDIHHEHLAQQRALAAERTLARKMAHLANTDGLTGLLNRRACSQKLAEEVERSQRTSSSFSILLADLDYFKQVNDTFGHDVGDVVLQEVAQLLTHAIRMYDYATRWGGEEFMVLLPDTLLDEALEIGERLREEVAMLQVPPVPHLSISIGVAQHQGEETGESLIKRADRGLYRAKAMGRNCVCPAPALRAAQPS